MGLMDMLGGGADKMKYKGLMDMIDGGGAGRAGQQFEGGALSGVLNNLGIKPRGFRDRMAQQRPQQRPTMSGRGQPMPAQAQPAMAQPSYPNSPPPMAPQQAAPQPSPPQPEQLTFEQFLQMAGPAAQLLDVNRQLQAYGEYLYGGQPQ